MLNLLGIFGANQLLGFSIEIAGPSVEKLSLDDRITISSMATEMGAAIILFPPSQEITDYCSKRSDRELIPVYADEDASYSGIFKIDVSGFDNGIYLVKVTGSCYENTIKVMKN